MVIRVYNVFDEQTLCLHMPMLVGDIDYMTSDGHLDVWNASLSDCVSVRWPVVEGAFKFFVRLKVGENVINIKFQSDILTLKLNREVPNSKNFVRPVYVVCADDDGYFQGPEEVDCSVQSAKDRIILGAMLIQTFTAEKMKEHRFGHKSFQLETDDDYEPVCHTFKSSLTIAEAHSMSGHSLWTHFAKELMNSDFSNKEFCKWYCFMSFTRYFPPDRGETESPKTHSEILKHTRGHTALGGGGLALFGTGNLHTWARSIEGIFPAFTDHRKIDRSKFMDDSAYREYYWANYATGLGASLHELGHTFDLGHTPYGIMARGFDDINRVFIVQRAKVKEKNRQRTRSASSSRDCLPRTSSNSSVESMTGSVTSDTGHVIGKRSKDVCFGSPMKKSNSTGSTCYIAPVPVMVKLESSFQLKTPSTLTFSMKNYDGTERHQTVLDEPGHETVTDMLLGADGRLLAKTQTRRERSSSASSVSSTSSPPSPLTTVPLTLPNSPEEPIKMPEFSINDGGAYWYRSSAVLLNFHKWFNKSNGNDSKKQPVFSGGTIKSTFGLRLVELRSDPEGVVFHHWEFIQETPPCLFVLKLSNVKNLPPNASTIMVLAEDNYGNIAKRKIKVEDFQK